MKIKTQSGRKGELIKESEGLRLDLPNENIVYNKDNIESISTTHESITLPGIGLFGSISLIIFTIIVDFGSLVSLDNQFINISGLLEGFGLLLLLTGIAGLIYTGYKSVMAYQYNTVLVIRGVSGQTHKLQVPKSKDIDPKTFLH